MKAKKEDLTVEHPEELEISNTDEEIIYPIHELKVDKGFYSVFELKRKYDSNTKRIILDSEFQREDVWRRDRKAELIESILMGLPLPIFYFNQDKYGRLVVIDGRQRLTALFRFMDNEFPLTKLTVLSDLNGKKFHELPPLLQGKIEDYQIQAHVILPPTPDRLKFDIFDRVNRGGMSLNKQEIRNALYQGKATKLLKELVECREFVTATDGAFAREERMKDKYLITRFLAIVLYRKKKLTDESGKEYIYRGNMDELLGKTMEYINHMDADGVSKLEGLTKECLVKAWFYGGKDIFRRMSRERKTPVNMNIFETVMYCMMFIPECMEGRKEKIFGGLRNLLDSSWFLDNIGNHRDGSLKMNERLDKAESLGRNFGKNDSETED